MPSLRPPSPLLPPPPPPPTLAAPPSAPAAEASAGPAGLSSDGGDDDDEGVIPNPVASVLVLVLVGLLLVALVCCGCFALLYRGAKRESVRFANEYAKLHSQLHQERTKTAQPSHAEHGRTSDGFEGFEPAVAAVAAVAAPAVPAARPPPAQPPKQLSKKKSSTTTEGIARSMFERHAGGDAFIDGQELRGLCKTMGRDLSDDDFAMVLSKLDTGGDGKVSFDEFLTWWNVGLSLHALRDTKVAAQFRREVSSGSELLQKTQSLMERESAALHEHEDHLNEEHQELVEAMQVHEKPNAEATRQRLKDRPGRLVKERGGGGGGSKAKLPTAQQLPDSPAAASPRHAPPAAADGVVRGGWGGSHANKKDHALNMETKDNPGLLTKRLGVGWRGNACPHGGITTCRSTAAGVDYGDRAANLEHSRLRELFKHHSGEHEVLGVGAVRTLCRDLGHELAADEEEQMMQRLDIDKDGKVSFDEFLLYYNAFFVEAVSSSAGGATPKFNPMQMLAERLSPGQEQAGALSEFSAKMPSTYEDGDEQEASQLDARYVGTQRERGDETLTA